MKKLLSLLLIPCFVFGFLCMGMTPLYASEQPIMDDSINHVVVYADHENHEEVLAVAQQAFDQGADSVEVRDTNKDKDLITPLATGWKQTTSPMYYFGDILHGSQGTIKGYVNGGSVSNCSLSVEVWGTYTSLYEKYLVNNYSTSVAGKWRIVVEGFMNAYSPTYTVSLY